MNHVISGAKKSFELPELLKYIFSEFNVICVQLLPLCDFIQFHLLAFISLRTIFIGQTNRMDIFYVLIHFLNKTGCICQSDDNYAKLISRHHLYPSPLSTITPNNIMTIVTLIKMMTTMMTMMVD